MTVRVGIMGMGLVACRGIIDPVDSPPPGLSDLPVDVLFVIDDTASMAERQQRLSAAIPQLVDILSESRAGVRFGVITTTVEPGDPDAGKLLGEPATLGTGDRAALAERVLVGTDGSEVENGLEAARLAVEGRAANLPRNGARLALLFLSDEEDCSSAGAITGPPGRCFTDDDLLVPVEEYVADLEAVAPVAIHGIFGQPNRRCEDMAVSHRLGQAVALTGGVASDLCASDWTDGVEAIARAILDPDDAAP